METPSWIKHFDDNRYKQNDKDDTWSTTMLSDLPETSVSLCILCLEDEYRVSQFRTRTIRRQNKTVVKVKRSDITNCKKKKKKILRLKLIVLDVITFLVPFFI